MASCNTMPYDYQGEKEVTLILFKREKESVRNIHSLGLA
jgi:hypothetical protein